MSLGAGAGAVDASGVCSLFSSLAIQKILRGQEACSNFLFAILDMITANSVRLGPPVRYFELEGWTRLVISLFKIRSSPNPTGILARWIVIRLKNHNQASMDAVSNLVLLYKAQIQAMPTKQSLRAPLAAGRYFYQASFREMELLGPGT
eukprot:757848-Pelagomonas_calceolata.AAC.2